jgi:hypothetical protein
MSALLAAGIAGCGGDEGGTAAQTLERPPLTVGADAELPTGSTRQQTTRTTTTPDDDTGGAADDNTGGAVDTGGTTDGTTDDGQTPQDSGGGATDTDTGGTQTQPANPGGAAPNFDEFCEENPGAC